MKVVYPIFGLGVIALYVVIAQRGIEPFGVSSNRTTAKAATAGAGTRTGGRRHSTFIWLGGYGGK